jgi:hypothetical protein
MISTLLTTLHGRLRLKSSSSRTVNDINSSHNFHHLLHGRLRLKSSSLSSTAVISTLSSTAVISTNTYLTYPLALSHTRRRGHTRSVCHPTVVLLEPFCDSRPGNLKTMFPSASSFITTAGSLGATSFATSWGRQSDKRSARCHRAKGAAQRFSRPGLQEALSQIRPQPAATRRPPAAVWRIFIDTTWHPE